MAKSGISTFYISPNIFKENNSSVTLQFAIFAMDNNAKKCIEDKQNISGYNSQDIRSVDSLSDYTIPIPYHQVMLSIILKYLSKM